MTTLAHSSNPVANILKWQKATHRCNFLLPNISFSLLKCKTVSLNNQNNSIILLLKPRAEGGTTVEKLSTLRLEKPAQQPKAKQKKSRGLLRLSVPEVSKNLPSTENAKS